MLTLDEMSFEYRPETSENSNIADEKPNVQDDPQKGGELNEDAELPTTDDTEPPREGETTHESSHDLMNTCMVCEIITGERKNFWMRS